MLFSIVIPVHNEFNSLKILLPLLCKSLEAAKGHEFEVLIVDDCSTDETRKLIDKFAAVYRYIRPIFLDHRSGQTGAFLEAFAIVRGEVIIRMDGDMQDHPEDLLLFFRLFEQGAELVMGLRECRKHRRLYRLAGYVYDAIILLLFNSPLHSNSGSFVGFQTRFVKKVVLKKNDHRFLPLIVMDRGAKDIREVFVRHGERQFDSSKYHPFKKLIFGFLEFISLFVRMRLGYYKKFSRE